MRARLGSRGSTLAEAAVALVLLSTIATLSWLAVSSTAASTIRGRSRLLATLELADLDRTLRDGARRVRAPPWSPGEGICEVLPDGLSAGYVDGVATQVLSLCSDQGIVVSLPGRERRFRRLRLVDLEEAEDAAGRVYGIEATVSGVGGQVVRIVAPFGAVPW